MRSRQKRAIIFGVLLYLASLWTPAHANPGYAAAGAKAIYGSAYAYGHESELPVARVHFYATASRGPTGHLVGQYEVVMMVTSPPGPLRFSGTLGDDEVHFEESTARLVLRVGRYGVLDMTATAYEETRLPLRFRSLFYFHENVTTGDEITYTNHAWLTNSPSAELTGSWSSYRLSSDPPSDRTSREAQSVSLGDATVIVSTCLTENPTEFCP